jgi:hypothetical protein
VAAGYSGTPLARKLGIKEGSDVVLVAAPPGWEVPDLPDAASVRSTRRVPAVRDVAPDVVVAFFRTLATLRRDIAPLGQVVFPAGGLWVAWPRKAGGHVSDISENDIRDVALPLGLVDNKVAAIDDDWSGLRVVWRRELRGET